MTELVKFEFIYVPDPDSQNPLFNAQLFFGVSGSNPSDPQNQIPVYAIQEDGSEIRLSQPVYTNSGGVPTYNGAPVRLTVDGEYSLLVLDSKGEQKYYSFDSTQIEDEGTVSESVNLTDGDLLVEFEVISTEGAAFYVGGSFVDRGRLFEGIDYTIIDSANINLTNSFPTGSVITGIQSVENSGSAPSGPEYFEVLDATSPHNLVAADNNKFITFNDASDATINIPDGLTRGFSVLTNNIGGGVVIFNTTGSDTIQGNATLGDSKSQMTIAKLTSNLWQSSER